MLAPIEIDAELLLKNGEDLEKVLFSNASAIIKKIDPNLESELLKLNKGTLLGLDFYASTKEDHPIGMFSSGTTKGSKTLINRSQRSIATEVLKVFERWQCLKGCKILIAATPNHSFGLIPALLTCRYLTKELYQIIGNCPLDIIKYIQKVKPQILFAAPFHIRALSQWIKKPSFPIDFLERIIFAGSPLSGDLVNVFHEKGVILTQLYGTTQTGAIAINMSLNSSELENCGQVLEGHIVTLSTDGELIVNSHPTGDRGFLNNARELILQGRIDHVIFKEGNKIDLRELENAIKHQLNITQIKIHCEKNMNGSIELVCNLPITLKVIQKYSTANLNPFCPRIVCLVIFISI